jgi:hypothetical protein
MSDDADHVLLTLERGERGEIRLARSMYQGRAFTKLQLWYPATDRELRPGRQCVTIRDHELGEVIEALQKIARKIGSAGNDQRQPSTPRPGRRSRLVEGYTPATDDEQAEDRGLF